MKAKSSIFILLVFIALHLSASISGEYLSKNYGEEIHGKILVAYATRAGSTIEVADSVAYHIAGKGYRVELRHINEVSDLSSYSLIIIGSAIRMGNVTPEIKSFVEKRKNEIETIPTAYFVVCLTLKDDTSDNREKVKEYLSPLRIIVQPFAEGYFAGKMDYSKLKRMDRFIVKRMVKAPEGDFRDWKLIREWAEELPNLPQASRKI
jgi:menaquinone-dependent protoporphyrinogen oxidase